MGWTSGITRSSGFLVDVVEWNNRNGAGGNFDFLSDGTRILSEQVYESSLNIDVAPTNGQFLVAKSGATGGLTWSDADGGPYVMGGSAVTGAFLTLIPGASSVAIATSVGAGLHYPAETFTDSGATDPIAIAAGTFLGIPTFSHASKVYTDAGTLVIEGAAAVAGGGSMTNPHSLLVLAGSVRIGAVGSQDGLTHILASSTAERALVLEVPTSSTVPTQEWHYNGEVRLAVDLSAAQHRLSFINVDLGNDVVGPNIEIGRNTNAGSSGAGNIGFVDRSGTKYHVHADDTGLLRIGTASPIGSADTTNGIVGEQSSWHALKNYILTEVTPNDALLKISELSIYDFTYKDSRYPEIFTGVVGMNRDDWFLKDRGKALNEISLHGYEILAIQALRNKIKDLEDKLDATHNN